jgi:hypothetical protein
MATKQEKSPEETEIVLPLKLDPHTFMRFEAYCRQVGQSPASCAAKLFRDLISDDEFESAPNQSLH